MWIGIANIIPITKKPIGGAAPPPTGDFIALESGLTDIVELEASTDLVELE
jgi:hypothetical protein